MPQHGPRFGRVGTERVWTEVEGTLVSGSGIGEMYFEVCVLGGVVGMLIGVWIEVVADIGDIL